MPSLVLLEDSIGITHPQCEIRCSTFYSGMLQIFFYGEFQTDTKVERTV